MPLSFVFLQFVEKYLFTFPNNLHEIIDLLGLLLTLNERK